MQSPDFTQSYNRFSYAWNNPLKYVDPDGEWVWLVPTIIGALVGGYGGYKIAESKGATGWKKFGYIFGGAVIGGVSGYFGASFASDVGLSVLSSGGSLMQSSFSAGMVSGIVSGGINSGGMTALAGGSLNEILGSMISGAVIGGFSGAAGGAAFQKMNNLLNKTISFGALDLISLKSLPQNTLSYMAGSTASQMTSNLLQGENPFKNIDYGLNIGLIAPLYFDILKYDQVFNMKLDNNKYPNSEIHGINSKTNFNSDGDLVLNQRIEIQEYFQDFKIEISNQDLTGYPRSITTDYYNVHTLSKGFKWQIFSFINILSLRP